MHLPLSWRKHRQSLLQLFSHLLEFHDTNRLFIYIYTRVFCTYISIVKKKKNILTLPSFLFIFFLLSLLFFFISLIFFFFLSQSLIHASTLLHFYGIQKVNFVHLIPSTTLVYTHVTRSHLLSSFFKPLIYVYILKNQPTRVVESGPRHYYYIWDHIHSLIPFLSDGSFSLSSSSLL